MKRRLTSLEYLGFTAMDPRFSTAMLPWLVMEIKKLELRNKLSVGIEGGYFKAYNEHFENMLTIRLINIVRYEQIVTSPDEFFLIVRSNRLLNFYMFRATSGEQVAELFVQMKDPSPSEAATASSRQDSSRTNSSSVTRNVSFGASEEILNPPWHQPISLGRNSNSNLSILRDAPSNEASRSVSDASSLNLASLSADLSPSSSHFFEVLYVGKVKVSNRKVPETIIDDALEKFGQHEAEKQKRRASLLSNQTTSLTSSQNNSFDNLAESSNKLDTSSTQSLSESRTSLATTSTVVENPKPTEIHKEKSPADLDFDMFTKERAKNVKNSLRKPNQIALEPNVLILNVPQTKSLTTLTEDDNESNKSDDVTVDVNSNFECKSVKYEEDIKTASVVNLEQIKEGIIDNKTSNVNNNLVIASDMKTKMSVSDSNLEGVGLNHRQLLRSHTALDNLDAQKLPENKPFERDRSASIGTLTLHKTPIAQLIGEQNRTMLFQVGNTELRLISPDRKQVLLRALLRDVSCAAVGRKYADHAGFVCREKQPQTTAAQMQAPFVCYCFKCESNDVAGELVSAIKLAFAAHADEVKKARDKSPNMTCEHCPMLWYHRLCHDLEGMPEKRQHATILRRIEQLHENEQETLIAKYRAATSHMYETCEHNAFLMILLRAHCEAKQQRHVHDTAENRSEFLNQYLGGGTIFMKAKRSLSSGFDHLLKRKASSSDILSTGANNHAGRRDSLNPPPDPPHPEAQSQSSAEIVSVKGSTPPVADITPEIKVENSSSPMLDIFLKLGDTKANVGESGKENEDSPTWRQAIFRRVTAQSSNDDDQELTQKSLLSIHEDKEKYPGSRSREELRELWRMAINQTIILVRMEKENAKLKESEESSAVRRIKLEYIDVCPCSPGATAVWDNLLANRDTPPQHIDNHILRQAVRQGVVRQSRGAVWYFLAEQACLRSAPPDAKRYPGYYTPYRTLLAGLTKHQHAILIDLGRTFPQHTYFSSALGPGQLSLYNILKAYSLLDPEVGYCQGLSFVAGLLLLHMEESEAFVLLRHLMFRRGLRKQYLPDMSALQVQLYQLSRLLRDQEPELHAHLERYDVSVALYAAPWMLTLFTSQFPLGFAARVFDLIFLDALDPVFAVSLSLLSVHKNGLMMCDSCEEIVEYLRHKLPNTDSSMLDKLFKKVYSLDITRQLSEYAVEYGVLREEMPKIAQLNRLKDENERLERDKQTILAELDSAMESISTYQSTQSRLENQIRCMEQQLAVMTRFTMTHTRQDSLPQDVKRVCQLYSNAKKVGFGNKVTSNFNLRVPSEEDDGEKVAKGILKTGKSTPNLFSKLSKDEIMNLHNNNAVKPVPDKKSTLKKSVSVNSGLIAPTLKVVQEKPELYKISQDQIRENRLKTQQMKHDFDENLRRLNERLYPDKSNEDLTLFQSKKSLSLNVNAKLNRDIEKNRNVSDSGFVTPMTPADDSRSDSCSVVSHPLSDSDVEIKYDGSCTKLGVKFY